MSSDNFNEEVNAVFNNIFARFKSKLSPVLNDVGGFKYVVLQLMKPLTSDPESLPVPQEVEVVSSSEEVNLLYNKVLTYVSVKFRDLIKPGMTQGEYIQKIGADSGLRTFYRSL